MSKNDTDTKSNTESFYEKQATLTELIVVAISVILTLSLLGFALFQLTTSPASTQPRASVNGTKTTDGHVVVTVVLRNPLKHGLKSATARVSCQQPPSRIQFTNVPAQGDQKAHVVCPTNTKNRRATVSNWMST